MAQIQEFLGTGRRKTAVARVRLAAGSGKIVINSRTFETYFPTDYLRTQITRPLFLTGTTEKFDVRVNVKGGGPSGQCSRHLAISQSLGQLDGSQPWNHGAELISSRESKTPAPTSPLWTSCLRVLKRM